MTDAPAYTAEHWCAAGLTAAATDLRTEGKRCRLMGEQLEHQGHDGYERASYRAAAALDRAADMLEAEAMALVAHPAEGTDPGADAERGPEA